VGERIADIRPPILFPLLKLDFQDGTAGAAAANAAPSICPVIYSKTKSIHVPRREE
jgi:hypothetical protein